MTSLLRALLDWVAGLSLVPPLFLIRVENGFPGRVQGAVAPRFVDLCGEILREHGIENATVRGFRNGASVRLRFSRQVPDPVRQKLRNVWSAYR